VSEVCIVANLDGFVDEVDRLMRRLDHNFECCDRALVACCGLTAAQANALLTLQDHEPLTMNEFAAEMKLHATTMTRMVDSLVDKGLTERQNDHQDRRIVCVVLTPAGREAAELVQGAKRDLLTNAFTDISAAEQATILNALGRLTAAAEQLGSHCCALS
jgi:DNA-binding MarR family transcriptional regulator